MHQLNGRDASVTQRGNASIEGRDASIEGRGCITSHRVLLEGACIIHASNGVKNCSIVASN
jgi:hypothetical protein